MSKRAEQKSQAREKAAALHATQLRAERRRRLLLAVGAVAVVLVVIGGLVAVRLAGGGKKETSAGPSGPADSNLIAALAGIPADTFAAVGSDGVQAAPSAITAPHLLSPDGKPKVLYVGAEFCPYCAAERWPVTVALSRFGTFSNLGTTHSAAADVYPNTASLSFHGSSYTSKYLAFTGVETTTNEEVNGRYAPLDKLTAEDQKTFDTFNQPPYVKSLGVDPVRRPGRAVRQLRGDLHPGGPGRQDPERDRERAQGSGQPDREGHRRLGERLHRCPVPAHQEPAGRRVFDRRGQDGRRQARAELTK